MLNRILKTLISEKITVRGKKTVFTRTESALCPLKLNISGILVLKHLCISPCSRCVPIQCDTGYCNKVGYYDNILYTCGYIITMNVVHLDIAVSAIILQTK